MVDCGLGQAARSERDSHSLGRAVCDALSGAIFYRGRSHQEADVGKLANFSGWCDYGWKRRRCRDGTGFEDAFGAPHSYSDDAIVEYLRHAWFGGQTKLPWV